MSTNGRRPLSRPITLAFVVGMPLLLAVACSSHRVTCGEGNLSKECLVSGDTAANDTTGSIRAQQAASRETTASARPSISKPATVTTTPTRVTIMRRAPEPARTVRLATRRGAPACDVTGSIPRRESYSPKSAKTSRSVQAVAHTVAPGETLYGIARRYSASVADLSSYNLVADATQLQAGSTIFIPSFAVRRPLY